MPTSTLGVITLNNALLLNWITLIIAIITLIIVSFQTFYTKMALKEAQKSIELTKTVRQLEILPRLHFIIHVELYLNKWNNELKEVIKFYNEKNIEKIIEISKKSITQSGLLDKYLYEKMPQWLAVIYESGAQYYYNSSCLYKYLWDEKDCKLTNFNDAFDRFKESSYYLEVLLQYIKDEVPKVFLNTPDSINTRDFF